MKSLIGNQKRFVLIAVTLYAAGIREAKVPLRDRSPRVAESIYKVVRLFHDQNVSAYEVTFIRKTRKSGKQHPSKLPNNNSIAHRNRKRIKRNLL